MFHLFEGVPVIPGTNGPVTTLEEAEEFGVRHGFPLMLKAAFGGGGRGMRVVHKVEVRKNFPRMVSHN